jgi:esterase/lipase
MKKKKIGSIISITILLLIVIFISGPRLNMDYQIEQIQIPESNLDQYLEKSEALVPGIKKGREKKIFWADGKDKKTEYAYLYFHGFPSARNELSPVFETVAKKTKSNIYYIRETGHGINGDALKNVTVNDWVNDALEAWEIGKKLGNKIILVGYSNGAPFVMWLADYVKSVEGIVLLAPHFMPADKRTKMLYLPWGNLILKLIDGNYHDITGDTKKKTQFLTFPYRTESLLTMMAFLKLCEQLPVESFSMPILSVFSEHDEVVSNDAILTMFNKWESSNKQLVNFSQAKSHFLAGDIMAPENNDALIDLVTDFVQKEIMINGNE